MTVGKIILAPKPHVDMILAALSVNAMEFAYVVSATNDLIKMLSVAIPGRLNVLIEVSDHLFTEQLNDQPTLVFRTSHKLIKYLIMDDEMFIGVSPGLEPIEHQDYLQIIADSIDELNRPSLN